MLKRYQPAHGLNIIIWRCLNGYSKLELSEILEISPIQYEWLEQFGISSIEVFQRLAALSHISILDWRTRNFELELTSAASDYEDYFQSQNTMGFMIQVTIKSQIVLDQNMDFRIEAFGFENMNEDIQFVHKELESTLNLNWKMITICLRRWLVLSDMVRA